MKNILSAAVLFFTIINYCTAQTLSPKRSYDAVCIGFYNLENLFDTIVDPDANKILQADFTPEGSKKFDTERYYEKLGNLSKVIADLGTETTPDGPAVLGVCEIENLQVLQDLVAMPLIKDRNYQIIQFDSPDKRGIDVALLYQEKYFKPTDSYAIPLKDPENADFFTRDQLVVSGILGGEEFHFIVAHWPSRRGGAEASEPKRKLAASLGRELITEIQKKSPDAKVIYMGDLNDDPDDASLKEVMITEGNYSEVEDGDLYNPMEIMHAAGTGSLEYRGDWFLYDQFICTSNLVDHKNKFATYKFYKAEVHDVALLKQATGKYQGTPFRTYGGRKWLGGFSDHFPIYMYLVKTK
ncbi:MAG: endonuclease/exonuclease/phosphatase family protein [Crocinitomicaceae bacterium]|nr:endonuclease/exonuclease/phosphatase family protein [Crocinitomicaceae bacterium]